MMLPALAHQLPSGTRWWGPTRQPEVGPSPTGRPDERPATLQQQGDTLTIVAGGWAITVQPPPGRHRLSDLLAALAEVGEALGQLTWRRMRATESPATRLALAAEPRTLLLALAWSVARGGLPSDEMLQTVMTQAATALAVWREGQLRSGRLPLIGDASLSDEATLTDAELATLVAETLAGFPTNIILPAHPWDEARWAVRLGQRLWRVTGDLARRWGCWRVPTNEEAQSWESDRASWLLATVASWLTGWLPVLDGLVALGGSPEVVESLPVTITGDRMLGAWLDWLALATGPGAPPAGLLPEGIGHADQEIQQAFDPVAYLSASDRLERTAAALLREASRPVPRYLDRLLEVAPPLRLIPDLLGAGIGAIRIQPTVRGTQRGLWLAVRAGGIIRAGQPTVRPRWHGCWWEATPESAGWVPWAMPFGLWPWLHAIAAALWHDLCTDAVVVVGSPAPLAGREERRRRPGREPSERLPLINLPGRRMVRPTPAQWGSAEEQALLAAATAVGHGYRRLPGGWEERTEREDFQRRRQAAAERAEEHGYPGPPVGFTFVRPHVRLREGAVTGRVRAQGLLALTLAAQGLHEAEE